MKPEATVTKDPDSGAVYGVLTVQGITVRELIPRHVRRWEDERQAAYYRGVLLRLQRKLMSQLALVVNE